MPRDRDTTTTPTTDHSWSKLQKTVNHEIPRSLMNTAHAIRKIRRMRTGR